MSSAVEIFSASAPPPTSQKLAGSPPACATTSSVLITSPAPLPRMPTSPSSLTYCRPTSCARCSCGSALHVVHLRYVLVPVQARVIYRTLASSASTRPSPVTTRVYLHKARVQLLERPVQVAEHPALLAKSPSRPAEKVSSRTW